MIEVFTTNIKDKIQSEHLLPILETNFPDLKINFDLEDVAYSSSCNNSILRVEGVIIDVEKIIATLNIADFQCDILEDKICIKNK